MLTNLLNEFAGIAPHTFNLDRGQSIMAISKLAGLWTRVPIAFAALSVLLFHFACNNEVPFQNGDATVDEDTERDGYPLPRQWQIQLSGRKLCDEDFDNALQTKDLQSLSLANSTFPSSNLVSR